MGASVFIRPVLAIAAVLSFAAPAAATVSVAIDLATQHMHVQSAEHTYDWPISSAREGYVTPDGTFAPTQMYVDYHSKKYDNAPMPHAIFFYYGFAIHGTNETRELGKPASHGCVRLSRANAATLFALVKAEGASITITGAPAGQPLSPVVTQASASTSSSGNLFGAIFGN